MSQNPILIIDIKSDTERTDDLLKRAIKNFKPFKSPGKERILPPPSKMVFKSPHLEGLFNASQLHLRFYIDNIEGSNGGIHIIDWKKF